MSKTLRALFIEDSADDSELMLRELQRGGYQVTCLRVETADEVRAALSSASWDIIISDYAMPQFDGLAALRVIKESGIDVPFIIVSGTIGEETAVEALKAGAHDFLVKGRLARLLPAIERELGERESRRRRREVEAALQESEMKYRRIVETAQEGIWMLDADRRTTYVNRRMAEMLGGHDAHDLLDASLLEFVDEEFRPIVLRCLDGEPKTSTELHELRFRRRDGSEFWASLSTSAVTDEQGCYEGVLAMVTDVTEQRKLQAQLMMSDRLVSVGTLAAGVAHEINNPLASVIANLEMAIPVLDDVTSELRGETPRLREVREQLGDASEAAHRVQSIVRDLKVFSRAQDESSGAIDVRVVLDSVTRLAWNEIRHRARLVKDYAEVPAVIANEGRLGQVFLNLVINATQAIPEGQADRHEIRLSTWVQGEKCVVVEIRDTGAGMPADVLGRVFTPFFTTKPVGVGTGLGLSICHRIVTTLGGEISVESEPGKGSAFRVLLRATSSLPAAASGSSAPLAATPLRRGSVMVVDDEPMMVKVLERMLLPEHDVFGTTVAHEALEQLRAGDRYDVILCDLMMPRITGMDFYNELLRIDPAQAQRVIFLTGGAFTPRMRAFLDEVENLRLEKPFEPAALRAVINARIAG